MIERTVREGEESSADDAGVRQRISTTQTVTTEKTESEDENKKRTVEITRERVVVQRKVTRSEKILQVSVVLIFRIDFLASYYIPLANYKIIECIFKRPKQMY